MIVDVHGRPMTDAVRVSMGFTPQQLPVREQDDMTGVRPPEVHPQDFYDAARARLGEGMRPAEMWRQERLCSRCVPCEKYQGPAPREARPSP